MTLKFNNKNKEEKRCKIASANKNGFEHPVMFKILDLKRKG